MSALKITLLLLAASVAVHAMDTSNFTCIGNPYFTTTYNPNATQPGTTDQSILSGWNVTYNSTTGIYDLSNYTGLPACKQLKNTGSCCGPDYINQTVQAYSRLFNATTDATMGLFNQRLNKLISYGKNYGKIFATFVDVISRGHEIVFKIVKNVNRILGSGDTIAKLMQMVKDTNSSDILNNATSGSIPSSINPQQAANITFQLVNIVAQQAGIAKGDIANFFGSIRALEDTFGSLPTNLFASFNAFPAVDPALISDTLDKWGTIFKDLVMMRSKNITLTVDLGGLIPAAKRLRFLADTTQSIPIPFPLILDPRNIEVIAKAMNDATKNAPNATVFFSTLLNSTPIYQAINNTWFTGINSLDDVKTGGSWDETKKLIVRIATFVFDDSLQKVVSVANNKKKCLSVVFQYQGYLGCLACDASAMSLGKFNLNPTAKTFSPIISSAFGQYVRGNCTDYIRDLIFMNSFLQGLKAMKTAYDVDGQSKQNPDNVDTDISKPIKVPNTTTIDSQLNIPCSINSTTCSWVQDNVIDSVGPTIGFLCDYSTDDCDQMDKLLELRGFQFKKNGSNTPPPPPPKRRMLDDASTNSSAVTYSDTATDEVSTTEVGFSTEPNYTVASNSTSNVTADNSTTTDTPATNTTNNTNGTKFGLKGLVSIPLIVATIVAFLL